MKENQIKITKPQRQASASFHPSLLNLPAHTPANSRTRSSSLVLPPNRYRSESTSSMDSNDTNNLNTIIKQDVSPCVPKNKIKLMDDVDLEKQLIMTAGGQKKVTSFMLKLLFLAFVVISSGVLIFYAL